MPTDAHPLRNHPVKLGRRERSHKPQISLRDFVDVEKAIHFIEGKRENAESPIQEKPLVDFSMLVRSWGMFGNDRLGDCTCAGATHACMTFAALVGSTFNVTEADVLRMYEHSGWTPADSQTDQGWTLEGAAGYLQEFGLLGKPDIVASAGVTLGDEDEQQVAMELFAGLYTGCEVQEAALTQFREGRPWEPVSGSPIAGGHCIWRVKSELRKSGVYVTWGSLQPAEEDWEKEFVDELMVLVPTAWESKLPVALVEAGIVDFSALESLVTKFG